MNKEELNKTIEDVSETGFGSALLLHTLNGIIETARRKGMLYGFVLGTCISTVVQIMIIILGF